MDLPYPVVTSVWCKHWRKCWSNVHRPTPQQIDIFVCNYSNYSTRQQWKRNGLEEKRTQVRAHWLNYPICTRVVDLTHAGTVLCFYLLASYPRVCKSTHVKFESRNLNNPNHAILWLIIMTTKFLFYFFDKTLNTLKAH